MHLISTLAMLIPSQAVSLEYLRLLGPDAAGAGAALAHPAFVYAGDCASLGSITVKASALGLDGYQRLAPRAEGSAGTMSDLDLDEFTVTPAPYFKGYEFSDLGLAIASNRLNPTVLAMDAQAATVGTLCELAVSLAPNFTDVVGTSNSALQVDDLLEAKGKLASRGVKGPILCILSSVQHSQIERELITLGGAAQWMPATVAQIEQFGEGYKGRLAEIDIFVTNLVTTTDAGVNAAGLMMGRGAVVWADASFAPEPDPNIIDFGPAAGGRAKFRFERDRRGQKGATAYMTHANLGVTIGIDDCAVRIRSKATF